jgi:hypothetical protein
MLVRKTLLKRSDGEDICAEVHDWIAERFTQPDSKDEIFGLFRKVASAVEVERHGDIAAVESIVLGLFYAFPDLALHLVSAYAEFSFDAKKPLAFVTGALSGLFLIGAEINRFQPDGLDSIHRSNIRAGKYDQVFLLRLKLALIAEKELHLGTTPGVAEVSGFLSNSIARYAGVGISGRHGRICGFLREITERVAEEPALKEQELLKIVVEQLVAKSLNRLDMFAAAAALGSRG